MEENQQPTNEQPAVPEAPAPQPAPTQPAPESPAAAPAGENPGKTLGILSLVFSLLGLGLVGLILGIVGLKKSKTAGMGNGLAIAGLIIGIINIIVVSIFIALAIFGGSKLVEKCRELGPGTHVENGVTYTCS